jgi:beta-glucosidase
LESLKKVAAKLPTAVIVHMDRPAILTNIRPLARVLLAEFGASDAAILDVLSGKAEARGRLPFSLPRSMQAVRALNWDTPHADKTPLYPIFYPGS